MKKLMLSLLLVLFSLYLFGETIIFPENRGKNGFNVNYSSKSGLEIEYSIERLNFSPVHIKGKTMTNVSIPGMILPNDAGAPNLPSEGRFIAIPQGANVSVKILSYSTETYKNIDLAPAPKIPFDADDAPLDYSFNEKIYGKNAFFPENIVKISNKKQIRGVEAVILGITPFRYNPITKELIVYKDIKVSLTFSGGNGHFGEDRLRSRWWDQILKANLINYNELPKIDYTKRKYRANEYDYVIIVPDDSSFVRWADSIKLFRQKQGIRTGIYTISDLGGNTVANIENFVDSIYNNWATPPSAVLLLSDYESSGKSYGITSQSLPHPYSGTYISDNIYADVVGNDSLPDITFSRITAQNESQLSIMIEKDLNYERNPPTDFNYYDNPVTACGFQTERWFQLASEIIHGFFEYGLGKNPIRINAIYSGSPSGGDQWSSATNTADVVSYFGESGLGYIPDTIPSSIQWNGTATDVVNAFNNGAFLIQHRDHGAEYGWGEPGFTQSNFSSLNNTLLPFVMSINCLTGRFDYSSEVFTEGLHRMQHGALGLVAATQVSYSFVNDAFIFGLYDGMWPQFDPGYPTKDNFVGYDNLRPAFAMESGKYYLAASNWPYNTDNKGITYNLFHMHGDAFMTLYSQVPESLTVSHAPTLMIGQTSFTVSADDSSLIALTVNGEIIGTAEGTGAPVSITIPAQSNPSDTLIVTVTKYNKFRYEKAVPIVSGSGPYVSYLSSIINDASGNNNGQINPGESINLGVYLKNFGA
ncbi:hypothetical protein DRP44_05800, partial [candidate division TA06 bacterium]